MGRQCLLPFGKGVHLVFVSGTFKHTVVSLVSMDANGCQIPMGGLDPSRAVSNHHYGLGIYQVSLSTDEVVF